MRNLLRVFLAESLAQPALGRLQKWMHFVVGRV
jgi:hypothetical protein